jgi:hypothetical protein
MAAAEARRMRFSTMQNTENSPGPVRESNLDDYLQKGGVHVCAW